MTVTFFSFQGIKQNEHFLLLFSVIWNMVWRSKRQFDSLSVDLKHFGIYMQTHLHVRKYQIVQWGAILFKMYLQSLQTNMLPLECIGTRNLHLISKSYNE